MAVKRYYIKCVVCGATGILRLQLEGQDESDEDIMFSCKGCGIPNLFHFSSSIKNGAERISLTPGRFELLSHELDNPDHYYTLAVDLPYRNNANDKNPAHFSTFIDQANIVGINNFHKSTALTYEASQMYLTDKGNLELLLHGYKEQNLGVYNTAYQAIFPESSVSDLAHTHSAINNIYAQFAVRLDRKFIASKSRIEIIGIFVDALRLSSDLGFLLSDSISEDCLRISVKCIDNFNKALEIKRAVRIGKLLSLYPEDYDLSEIWVALDRFDQMRIIYLDSYENFHKSIEYLIMALNTSQGRAALYIDNRVLSQGEMRKYPAALKRKYLINVCSRYANLSKVLADIDNKLRNSIGHGKIQLDRKNNTVNIDGNTTPYSEFFIEFYKLFGINIIGMTICRWVLQLNAEGVKIFDGSYDEIMSQLDEFMELN